jgi:hypothetical protein
MSIQRCEYDSQDRTRLTFCLVAAGLLLSAMAAVRADEPGRSTKVVPRDVRVGCSDASLLNAPLLEGSQLSGSCSIRHE